MEAVYTYLNMIRSDGANETVLKFMKDLQLMKYHANQYNFIDLGIKASSIMHALTDEEMAILIPISQGVP